MAIGVNKILTISAQDYVGPGVNVRDKYRLVGVHDTAVIRGVRRGGLDYYMDFSELGEHLKYFTNIVPKGTEVVVGLERHFSIIEDGNLVGVLVSGTALIPKKPNTDKKK
ncbi:MAG TPA: hypothetical protein VJH92_05660 [Candidatus Nanoarchaeia archaeon]|nr:hypothetical protein [Candidatus Nanoarchaeia archaeon]